MGFGDEEQRGISHSYHTVLKLILSALLITVDTDPHLLAG